MKRSILVFLLLFSSSLLFSQYREKLIKIGYVNIQYVVKKYSKGRRVINYLKNLKSSYEKKIASMEDDLKKLEKELEIKSKDLNETQIRQYLKQIEAKRQELEIFIRNANKHVKEKEKSMLEPLYKNILKVVRKVAEDKKYNFILDSKHVLVADPELNITRAVIKELEKRR